MKPLRERVADVLRQVDEAEHGFDRAYLLNSEAPALLREQQEEIDRLRKAQQEKDLIAFHTITGLNVLLMDAGKWISEHDNGTQTEWLHSAMELVKAAATVKAQFLNDNTFRALTAPTITPTKEE
jgi:hypothetical protein